MNSTIGPQVILPGKVPVLSIGSPPQ